MSHEQQIELQNRLEEYQARILAFAKREEGWADSVAQRDARIAELDAALKIAIHELECSGLHFDHPLITQLTKARQLATANNLKEPSW
jgi:LPS O-antigen subunit length determinant protein (WzzB/FepE family)